MHAGVIIFDSYEHFEKMTSRNRYKISGANNCVLLTVPLIKGRNQRIPMQEVLIYNEVNWQLQHWRTLVSVYRSAPYFDHYEGSLKALFETPFTSLLDFSRAGINWVKQQLHIDFQEQASATYIQQYGTNIKDLRKRTGKNGSTEAVKLPSYHQVFEERNGFIQDLSVLDMLFSEGPYTTEKLRLVII